MSINQSFSTQTRSLEEDIISEIIERHKDNPSINLIKYKNSCLASTFPFMAVSTEEIINRISKPKKSHTRKRYSYQYFKTKFGFCCSSTQTKTAVGNGGVFAALLSDLSEAFDCVPHDLTIAKLAANGFDTNAYS